jgi:triacylglycerol lipase
VTPRLLIIALAAVALALLAGGALLFRRWRRRKAQLRPAPRPTPARRISRLRQPVVLAHGILGFDQIDLPGVRQEYFRGVPERLRGLGAEVHAIRVGPLSSVKERAEELARAVKQLDAERVNIIAHSMGGLDARYAITKLGLATRVASLTTIGTPHRGTPLADIGTALGDKLKLRGLLEKLGLATGAFYDLTTANMQAFNDAVPDAPGILYGSYAGRTQGLALVLNPLLLPTFLYLSDRAGENDGLVPTASQPWGELLGRVEADHWAQIGWSPANRFDAPAFYADLLRELTARGL